MNAPKEYALIEMIRERPSMYLGSKSITALRSFLDGYSYGLREMGYKERYEMFPLNFGFMHEYTAQLYGFYGSTAGWRNHILWNNGGDEEKALFKFFELFDEFKEIRAEKCWRAVLSAENIAYNNSMEHAYSLRADKKQPVYDNPICVYVIKLTIPAYLLAVETYTELCVERAFYPTFERAAADNDQHPGGAEVYFGKIDGWTEIADIDKFIYGKQILIH